MKIPTKVRSARRSAAVLLAGAALTCGSLAFADQASAATGGIDMNRACKNQRGYLSEARVGNSSNAYSWYCRATVTPFQNLGGLDLNRACRNQYAKSWAYARVGSTSNPYSWYCVF